MTLKIKNWHQFQHFKDRKPPWIKLYRELLDDIVWHQISGEDAKTLIMLWLIASENDGILPEFPVLAFRLRTTQKSIKSTVSRLSHWLIQDDIKLISDITTISERYQDDPLETETETETETEASRFELFWKPYPKKVGKPAALKAFKSQHINGELNLLLADIESKKSSDAWTKNNGQFIPNPATYLNQRRWEDSIDDQQSSWMDAGK